jgi:hypothetical protein
MRGKTRSAAGSSFTGWIGNLCIEDKMTSMASRLSKGDSFSWEELYDAIADRLFHYLIVLTEDRDAAAETLQETFVRLFRHRQRLLSVEETTSRHAHQHCLQLLQHGAQGN